MPELRLILASTSVYRRELLSRLRVPFETASPGTEEATLPGEAPADTALRLAREKSRAVQAREPEAVVIGSDQVAALGELRLGKPGNRERAIEQLLASSGKTVDFHTAICVGSGRSGVQTTAIDCTRVTFRTLSRDVVERYVDAEKPFDCAGSAKAEGLGIALIERIESTDPTGLIGLPLILLTSALAEHGIRVP